MANARNDEATRQPLRLWPGVTIVVLQWVAWVVVPALLPDATLVAWAGGAIGGFAVLVWWLFFSRAHWFERLGAFALSIVALAATPRILHASVATAGQGMMFFMYAIPVLSLAFVVSVVASRNLSDSARRGAMATAVLLACGGWGLVRSSGITGDGALQPTWRWTETPEERLMARAGDEPTALPSAPLAATTLDTGAGWPGFRGPGRDGVVTGVRIETDWSVSPPIELWRRPIGPAVSSLAVRGDLLYTQEQRGDFEVVAAYKVSSGEPVWQHRDAVRFWDSHAGAGPRSTPTVSGARVYTFGATGILNVLDADDGALVWSRDVASEIGAQIPGWGFSSSPLVVDDVVIVAASSRLVAYELATGEQRWLGKPGGGSYSSPHLMTIDGVAQVLLMRGTGVISVAPADGTMLWEHPWPAFRVVQPALTSDGDLLIAAAWDGGGTGIRRITVARGAGGWTIQERWTSTGLKPYFNDFVVHDGHAYGFDNSILACIELESGARKWKGGRYGHGQLVLLPDTEVLLVVSEEGELVLVSAIPDEFTEIARFQAIEGKTWNHPVLVGDVLLVRNTSEMVAFRLPLAD